jgi:hypothetical protein
VGVGVGDFNDRALMELHWGGAERRLARFACRF